MSTVLRRTDIGGSITASTRLRRVRLVIRCAVRECGVRGADAWCGVRGVVVTLALALGALFIALVALAVARRAVRQNAQLTDLYWQLKYEHGEMKAKVFPPEPAPSAQVFVALSDVKKAPKKES